MDALLPLADNEELPLEVACGQWLRRGTRRRASGTAPAGCAWRREARSCRAAPTG
jgi:hypothetical protein